MITKNTYGISVSYSVNHFGRTPKELFSGSSLQRKKAEKKPKNEEQGKKVEQPKENKKADKLYSMSDRTKQKIRKKITCFSQTQKRLSFVTLTFLNKVTDEQAINLLRKFLDNVKKRSENFQYVWVAERQTKNDVFKGNIHFHMITNKYWKIDKWWNYWMDLQIKNGIEPREKDFRPSSAFDVKQLSANNVRSIAKYVTKYVTKNKAKFKCQVWNCSKGVSNLYTDFYTPSNFLENFEKLDAINKTYEKRDQNNKKFLEVNMIDLNKKSLKLYDKLGEKNREILTQ